MNNKKTLLFFISLSVILYVGLSFPLKAGADTYCNGVWLADGIKCGYVNAGNNGVQTVVHNCPPMAIWNGYSSCRCDAGYVAPSGQYGGNVSSDGQCVLPALYCEKYGVGKTYNMLTGSCECESGYVSEGSQCIGGDSYCRDKYGTYSRYNSFSEKCECDNGYVMNSSYQCVSSDSQCQNLLGNNSRYDPVSGKCVCQIGYMLSDNTCVNQNTYCHNKYGNASSYDNFSKICRCDSGYSFNASQQCVNNDNACKNKYGHNAKYDTFKEVCICSDGYFLNSAKTSCIDASSYCREIYGFLGVFYNILTKKCDCEAGYLFSDNKCIDATTYCQNKYGNSTYDSSTQKCACSDGYEFNSTQGVCIKKAVVNIKTPEITKKPDTSSTESTSESTGQNTINSTSTKKQIQPSSQPEQITLAPIENQTGQQKGSPKIDNSVAGNNNKNIQKSHSFIESASVFFKNVSSGIKDLFLKIWKKK